MFLWVAQQKYIFIQTDLCLACFLITKHPMLFWYTDYTKSPKGLLRILLKGPLKPLNSPKHPLKIPEIHSRSLWMYINSSQILKNSDITTLFDWNTSSGLCKLVGGPVWPVWHICRERRDMSCIAILGPGLAIHWTQWLAHNSHTALLLLHISVHIAISKYTGTIPCTLVHFQVHRYTFGYTLVMLANTGRP